MYNPDDDYKAMLAKLRAICQNKNISQYAPEGNGDVNLQFELLDEGRNETIYLYGVDNL